MAEQFEPDLLARLVTAHLAVNPDRLSFEPVRTGKHNTSYYVWCCSSAPPTTPDSSFTSGA